jgi:hypothetical protein
MNAHERTAPLRYEWNYGGMEDVPDGDFVAWEDYATLAAEKERLERERDALKALANTNEDAQAAIDWLERCDAARLELAARIRALEEALLEWDALIKHQYHGSREAMSDMTVIAQKTAALLKLGAWSDTLREEGSE